jgi:DNA-binding NarL/FixJ family response regulator
VVTISGIRERKDFHQYCFQQKLNYQPIERLTKRELEVTIMVSKGYCDREISELMNNSIHTIRTHRRNILKKTMSKNGSELVKKCIELGYI